MQALSQINAGDTCTIKWMFGVPEILETMRNMDIKEGSTIQVIQKCRDWLIIGRNDRRLAVGDEVAGRVSGEGDGGTGVGVKSSGQIFSAR